ncbi:uncharacterized protein LOC125116950 [Phacochoerus africanus]|uniref:uncharacterized protein LOC125116950 n=1 Tax=Phacochoerus africanus TaxID=41426 RepID=UPI001FD9972E|nr:uncharacterized protein LOC125116950 [Phacochoerus africanus]
MPAFSPAALGSRQARPRAIRREEGGRKRTCRASHNAPSQRPPAPGPTRSRSAANGRAEHAGPRPRPGPGPRLSAVEGRAPLCLGALISAIAVECQRAWQLEDVHRKKRKILKRKREAKFQFRGAIISRPHTLPSPICLQKHGFLINTG